MLQSDEFLRARYANAISIRHFNNVAFLAWNTVLPQDQYPDDQPGNFPCTNKAYGPYEAISLNQRNSALAKINIENYVWYALVGIFSL